MKYLFLFLSMQLLCLDLTSQWTLETLSTARSNIAAFGHDDKVYFVGGSIDIFGSSVIDIYDFASDAWSVAEAPVNATKWSTTDAGDYVVIHSGSNTIVGSMMIFDKNTSEWSEFEEINPRFSDGIIGLNNQIFFGAGGGFTKTNELNILNLESRTWSVDSLSIARNSPAVATYNSKVFFIGGETNLNFSEFSDVVDVYDIDTQSWETFNLTLARSEMAVQVIDDKLIIAGGRISNQLRFTDLIEVIDLNDYSIETFKMSTTSGEMVSMTINGKALFIGGHSTVAEIFDPATSEIISHDFGGGNNFTSIKGARIGNMAVFANNTQTSNALIYNDHTGEWSTYDLGGERRDVEVVSHRNKLFIAGGSFGDPFDEVNVFTSEIDNDNDTFYSDVDCDDNNPNINPDAEEIANNGIDENCDGKDLIEEEEGEMTVELRNIDGPWKFLLTTSTDENITSIEVLDDNGEIIISQNVNKKVASVNIKSLESGTYTVIAYTNKGKMTEEIIVD